jgi:hypothetical protein
MTDEEMAERLARPPAFDDGTDALLRRLLKAYEAETWAMAAQRTSVHAPPTGYDTGESRSA